MFLGRALPDNRESHSQFQLVPSTSLLALFKMAEMADAVEEIPSYLSSVLDEADALLNNQSVDINSLEMHVVVLDRTVSFLRAVSEMDTEDQCDWISLSQAFSGVLAALQQKICELLTRPSTAVQGHCIVTHMGEPGRPKIQISREMIENLRGFNRVFLEEGSGFAGSVQMDFIYFFIH